MTLIVYWPAAKITRVFENLTRQECNRHITGISKMREHQEEDGSISTDTDVHISCYDVWRE